MTRHDDMMPTDRAARAMRRACAFGVVALSACAPSPKRAARSQAAPLAKAVGGQVRLAGNSTFNSPPRIATADHSDSMAPVQVSDTLRHDALYQTGTYIKSTQR